ncbi:tyrosine-protein phosphatase [Melaminivora sp.]|uniref:tyrosine-protein phosphatase n=1 Tax=Melaminivora sp. TaxID=1933032 RepID=UPI0028B05159|nr:CpsB/CapC family capsule biosynthesis tyrosine phosphatase [Melaminivora sp.]
MIDLHTHILPGIDDGARSLDISLEMARIAVSDGTTTLACTPHIYPGLYMNDSAGIHAARDALQRALDEAQIALKLVVGADAHLVPELLSGLKSGRVPTLNGSRYFLLEPSHHVAPPQFEDSVFQIMAAGYTPVVTHPERLVWIEENYATFVRLAQRGAWMQLTAGAVVGKFGKRARYWSERLLGDGLVHLVASDAHTVSMRSPRMSDALPLLESHVGGKEAARLLNDRPQAILDDVPPHEVLAPPGLGPEREGAAGRAGGGRSWLKRLFG